MFPLLHVAQEFAAAAARAEPEDMITYRGWLAQLPEVFSQLGEALRVMTEKANSEYPLEPPFIEAMASLCLVQKALEPMAEDLRAVFEILHQQEITRQEQPRPGEHMWNTRK